MPRRPLRRSRRSDSSRLEKLIAANLGLLFPGMEIVESSPFRVTRDAEVAIQELESDDLLETIDEAMRERRFLEVVRLKSLATCRKRFSHPHQPDQS